MLLTNLISLYLLSVSGAVIFSAVHIRTLNGANYTRTTLFLGFAVCTYILGYAMELNSSTEAQIMFWNHIEYIGIPFVSALWLTTALQYTGNFARNKPVWLAAIYIIPFITLTLRFTNGSHHLYFSSVSFNILSGSMFLMRESGPWMYVQMIHSMLMIFVAMGFFIHDSVMSKERQHGKIRLVVLGSLFAAAGLVLTQLRPFGLPIDYMALCLPLTCIMVILSISRYDLLETKAMARNKAFEASKNAILLLNRQNRILDYNKSAKALFEQIGIRLDNRRLSSLFGKTPVLLEALENSDPLVVSLNVGFQERYFDISIKRIDEHDELRGYIKTILDVTEIYQLNAELKKQAMTDELSVLSNRRAFIKLGQEWVDNAEKSGISLHLLMMDLDHFKNVNDQYGHPTGDLMIREFGQMLKAHFTQNALIARLGGEEFSVLLSDFADDEIDRMLEKMLEEAARHEYSYFGNRFHVTVSIGMTKKHPGQSLESLMRNADRALYQSKDRGRNCITVV